LLLTLYYRYFRPIIDGGFLYIAQPPLYKIQKGKEVHYAFTDEEKHKIVGIVAPGLEEVTEDEEEEVVDEVEVAETEVATKKTSKVRIQRYKGLGEMNPEELWETTMNPNNRILKQVSVQDGQDADRVFDILMGTDVSSRKSFIQSNARSANIDV
jgi:DNA gyrase subunit B